MDPSKGLPLHKPVQRLKTKAELPDRQASLRCYTPLSQPFQVLRQVVLRPINDATSSTSSAAVATMRRAPQLGQKPRRLQLKATSRADPFSVRTSSGGCSAAAWTQGSNSGTATDDEVIPRVLADDAALEGLVQRVEDQQERADVVGPRTAAEQAVDVHEEFSDRKLLEQWQRRERTECKVAEGASFVVGARARAYSRPSAPGMKRRIAAGAGESFAASKRAVTAPANGAEAATDLNTCRHRRRRPVAHGCARRG